MTTYATVATPIMRNPRNPSPDDDPEDAGHDHQHAQPGGEAEPGDQQEGGDEEGSGSRPSRGDGRRGFPAAGELAARTRPWPAAAGLATRGGVDLTKTASAASSGATIAKTVSVPLATLSRQRAGSDEAAL